MGGEEDSGVGSEAYQVEGKIGLDHEGEVHVFEYGDDLKLMMGNLVHRSDLALTGNKRNKLFFHLFQQDSLTLITDHKI